MKFILNKDKLTVENEECANSGSVQYYEVEVQHDESWNDLIIEAVIVPKEGGTLIFDDAESIAEIDNKIYIDRELSGSYAIGFRGFTIENEVKVYQISTNLQGVYFNVGAGQIITTNSIPKPSEWEIYAAQIEAIANRASQSADDAQTSADNAETSAENAQTSAETATEQAETATEKASNASGSATIATEQAGIATTKAGEASTSASKAKTSEDNAKASEQSASGSAESASASAESAGASAGSAATSASLASSSEGVASQKAREASASANSASASAESAEQSKNTAQGLVNGFTSTVQTATNNFNTNATEKTNAFNTNATNKTNAFNENATNKTTTFNENATSKTTDFNDNASDKTTEFNEVVDTAKDDIEEIAPMLQDKIAKIPSMMEDKTVTGTSIHTEDSADWYGKLNFEGFSRQETTTGKNKFSGWTKGKTINPNNGGQSNSETGAVSDYLEVDFNTTDNYTISGLVDTLFSFVAAYNSNKEFLGRNGALDRNTRTISSSSFTSGTPQGTGDIAYIRVTQYESGSTTGTIELIDNAKTQFEIGSEATDYEPYTGGIPQPNPDYPSEIRNLESNGNLFTGWTKGKRLSATNGNVVTDAKAAISDFMPVDFTKNPNYYLQGLSSNLSAFVAAYNSDKQFLGRTGIGQTIGVSIYSSAFSAGTPQGTGEIAYVRVTSYEYNSEIGTIDVIDNLETQISIGTHINFYAPYDSLRFKQVGKNLALNDDPENPDANYYATSGSSAVEYSTTEEGFYTTTNRSRIIPINKSGNFVFSLDLKNRSLGSSTNVGILYAYNTNTTEQTSLGYISSVSSLTSSYTRYSKIFSLPSNYNAIRILFYNHLFWKDIQIEEGSTATEYEPYKEHNIDFPCNGEKFYAGSELTDNGISHIRKQILLQGASSEHWAPVSLINEETLLFVLDRPRDILYGVLTHGEIICNRLPNYNCYGPTNTREGLCVHQTGGLYVRIKRSTLAGETVADFKNWLAENNLLVEYPLAEPEIIPYTQAQQDAYDEMQNLETYQYVNNIELIANEETNMTFDYKKDIQMQIENIESRLTLLE